MRTKLLFASAVVATLGIPRIAGAVNPLCSSLPDPIVVAGSSAVQPFIKEMGKVLAGQGAPTTLIYQKQGSCTGVTAVVNDTTPAGACASGSCITGTALYYDTAGTQLACDLSPTGTHVDVGMSDVWSDTCTGSPPPTGVKDFTGPVEAMLFVVPKASQQVAITMEEAFFAFGYGASGMAKPWTTEAQLMVRNALSGTQHIIAYEIQVPAGRWKGVDKGGSQQVADAVAQSTSPEATIGILGADFYDQHRDTLTALAFQAYHQRGAFYADSTATSFDKRNLRNGHYLNWGYLHMITHVDGTGVPNTAASKRFVDWVTGNTTSTAAPFDITNITILAHLVPPCAMKVKRSSEGGSIAVSTPATDCSTAYEAAVAH